MSTANSPTLSSDENYGAESEYYSEDSSDVDADSVPPNPHDDRPSAYLLPYLPSRHTGPFICRYHICGHWELYLNARCRPTVQGLAFTAAARRAAAPERGYHHFTYDSSVDDDDDDDDDDDVDEESDGSDSGSGSFRHPAALETPFSRRVAEWHGDEAPCRALLCRLADGHWRGKRSGARYDFAPGGSDWEVLRELEECRDELRGRAVRCVRGARDVSMDAVSFLDECAVAEALGDGMVGRGGEKLGQWLQQNGDGRVALWLAKMRMGAEERYPRFHWDFNRKGAMHDLGLLEREVSYLEDTVYQLKSFHAAREQFRAMTDLQSKVEPDAGTIIVNSDQRHRVPSRPNRTDEYRGFRRFWRLVCKGTFPCICLSSRTMRDNTVQQKLADQPVTPNSSEHVSRLSKESTATTSKVGQTQNRVQCQGSQFAADIDQETDQHSHPLSEQQHITLPFDRDWSLSFGSFSKAEEPISPKMVK